MIGYIIDPFGLGFGKSQIPISGECAWHVNVSALENIYLTGRENKSRRKAQVENKQNSGNSE